MERALYDAEHGYYSSGTPRYGRGGDFLTAPTASPWYARVIARVLKKVSGEVGPVDFVDLAAGDASFLHSLLHELGPEGRAGLGRVLAVEQSEGMRKRCARALGDFPETRVEILPGLVETDVPAVPVILHASELYDALPVSRVIMREDGMREFYVRLEGDSLSWEERPPRAELMDYFLRHGVVLAPGQVAEANLRAEGLHRTHLQWAGADALALILDYGYESRRLYDPRGRFQGSLSCFYRHELSRDPLKRPGEQDITAHVNWDDLRRAANHLGWEEISLEALTFFLIRSGIAEIAGELGLGMEAELDARTLSERQELKRLLDPEGMGSDLKMLVQGIGRLKDVI